MNAHVRDNFNVTAPAVMTTLGDTIYASAANTPARIPIGTTGQTWGVAGGIPAWNVYGITVITHSVLAAPAASFDFTSISGSYKHLEIIFSLRTDRAATNDGLNVRINNDSGNNYDSNVLLVTTSASVSEGIAQSSMTSQNAGIAGANAQAGDFGGGRLLFPDYANANHKPVMIGTFWGRYANSTGNISGQLFGGGHRTTGALTRITLLPNTGSNFAVNSTATLLAYN